MVLDIDVDLKFLGVSLTISNLHSLAPRVVDTRLVNELVKEGLGNVVVSKSIPCHQQLVEIMLVCNNVSLHALVVNQVEHQ